MTKMSSSGKCNLCGGTFGKAAMGRHLAKCRGPGSGAAGSGNQVFHLRVQSGHGKMYWMHLAVPQELKLKKLDQFLRRTWLECCGHLSAFTIHGQRYSVAPMEDIFDARMKERSMNVAIGDVLDIGSKFLHEYDFGSTTELSLEVVGLVDLDRRPERVEILARNDAPQIVCEECGANASQVCAQCLWKGDGWLCDKCAPEHKCGEEFCLPVVNSPRVGVCGYTG